jgi:hypothetical protein
MKRSILREEENVEFSDAPESARRPPDSVDDQIDEFLITFESHAIDAAKGDSEFILESLKSRSLRAFLFEQDPPGIPSAPEGPAEDLFAAPEEPKASPPAGSEQPKKNLEPSKPIKQPLDVDVFAKNVVRLWRNSHNLLQVQPVIIERALRFLEENYGKEYAEDLIENLRDKIEIQDPADDYDAPLAPGAAGKSGA